MEEALTDTSKKAEEGYVWTEDGRKIKLLDNPLPVPPRHVKKVMDFEIDDVQEDDFQIVGSWRDDFQDSDQEEELKETDLQDDFDFEIKEGDDFDI